MFRIDSAQTTFDASLTDAAATEFESWQLGRSSSQPASHALVVSLDPYRLRAARRRAGAWKSARPPPRSSSLQAFDDSFRELAKRPGCLLVVTHARLGIPYVSLADQHRACVHANSIEGAEREPWFSMARIMPDARRRGLADNVESRPVDLEVS